MNASGVGLGSEEPFRDAKCFLCQIAFFVKNNKDLTEKPSGVFLTCVRCSNTYHPGCVQVPNYNLHVLDTSTFGINGISL